MAEFSYPFDGGTGSILTENDWSSMAMHWQDDGVIVGTELDSTDLMVTSEGVANTVILQPGSAMIQGFTYRNTEPLELTFATNSASSLRRDRVVLRLDRNSNTISAMVKQGTPDPSPVPPGLNTTYPIYEISLASFFIGINGGNTVASGSILQDRPIISRYVRISESTSGHPEGSLLYVPSTDKFYTVGAGSVPTEIGAPVAPDYFLKFKESDGSALTGSGVIVDPDLQYTFPASGLYRVNGEAFLSPSSTSATCNFSLTSVPTPTWVKGHFTNYAGAQLVTTATTTTFGVTAPAVSDIPVKYDFTINVTGSQLIACRTNAHSGTWRMMTGSWIRVEKVNA